MGSPAFWPLYPFLPLSRRGAGEMLELGLLYDAPGVSPVAESAKIVFRANLFLLPSTEAAFFALPREEFVDWEALLDAGWRVD